MTRLRQQNSKPGEYSRFWEFEGWYIEFCFVSVPRNTENQQKVHGKQTRKSL